MQTAEGVMASQGAEGKEGSLEGGGLFRCTPATVHWGLLGERDQARVVNCDHFYRITVYDKLQWPNISSGDHDQRHGATCSRDAAYESYQYELAESPAN